MNSLTTEGCKNYFLRNYITFQKHIELNKYINSVFWNVGFPISFHKKIMHWVSSSQHSQALKFVWRCPATTRGAIWRCIEVTYVAPPHLRWCSASSNHSYGECMSSMPHGQCALCETGIKGSCVELRKGNFPIWKNGPWGAKAQELRWIIGQLDHFTIPVKMYTEHYSFLVLLKSSST
jgi:hypothetical protein